MAIPASKDCKTPILKCLNQQNGPITLKELKQKVADEFHTTNKERNELEDPTAASSHKKFDHNISNALMSLKREKRIERISRETYNLTKLESANMLLQNIEIEEFNPKNINNARETTLRNIAYRQGAVKFRRIVLEAYGSVCAITGCDVVQVLEAAHIKPYNGIDTNHVQNGILLRADIHTLFDLELIAIEPTKLRVKFSKCLRSTPQYKKYHGREIRTPKRRDQWPNEEVLKTRWEQFEV